MPRFEARAHPAGAMYALAPLIASLMTLVTGFVLFSFLHLDPLVALHQYFVVPLADKNGVAEWLLKASPLALIGCGLAVGFRANIWNIGAEGQLILGAIAACALAIAFETSTSAWLLPAMIALGAIAGAAWAALAAWLRTRYNANEILVTLMLSYIAALLLAYLVHGPMRDPAGQNFPQSIMFADASLFPILWQETRLNTSIFISMAGILAAWLFHKYSFLAFQMRVAGQAADAARYAGFRRARMVWLSLCIGGAAAGIAGVGEVAGPLGQLQPAVSPGYGFAAIIVAFMGRLHPVGILLAALLMSLLYIGGESAQVSLQLPNAITGVFQGLLLFYLLGCDVLTQYRVRWT